MSIKVTVELPDELAARARAAAVEAQRPFEDLLVEWIDRAATEPPVESLADDQLLQWCDGQMADEQQTELSDLLAQQQDGVITASGRDQLERLMTIYRRGLVRKAQALRIAVQRGLRPPLS